MRAAAATILTAVVGLAAACAGAPEGSDPTETVTAAVTIPTNLPPPLTRVPVPEPTGLAEYVVDRAAAIALGKALFWDMQMGSDGKTACATCHFNAGADSRSRNQITPGLLRKNAQLTAPDPDVVTSLGGLNYQLRPSDFPTHRIADINNRDSAVLADTNDVVASQGVTYGIFKGLTKGDRHDLVETAPDPDGFKVGAVNVRRVEPRNTPTTINAVYNFRQFWDGRAQDEFNGVNAWGQRDPFAFVYKADAVGAIAQTRVRIKNASLASQAMAPPLSSFEMSADGRTFVEIGDRVVSDKSSAGKGKKLPRKSGKKMADLRPLAEQQVSATDSVLAPFRASNGKGLNVSYQALIQRAFTPAWWRADTSSIMVDPVTGERSVVPRSKKPGPDEYSLLEYNFSLFFGLSVALYEATLVSADTPFDRYLAGSTTALTDVQKEGMALFYDTVRVRCVNCHGGAELTDASHSKVTTIPLRRREGNLLDRGFNNINLRPMREDVGLGEADPWGMPLSMARLATFGLFNDPAVSPPVGADELLGDDGAFKVPSLRNVALTAPYFHDGGTLTLRQVIDFYSRGGNFQPQLNRSGQLISPVSTPSLTDPEKDALVAFLGALTDDRVLYQRAPFDHPELRVPDGHQGDHTAVVTRKKSTQPADRTLVVPAVGAAGGTPIPTFLQGAITNGPDEE